MNETAEYLVCRLTPRTKNEFYVATPAALAVSATFGVLALMALRADAGTGALILACLGVVSFVAAWSTRVVPHPYPPLPKGHEGWQMVTELIRLSPDLSLRDYIFLGTLYGSGRAVPVLLHKHTARHHVHILGATGRHKSSGLVVPVLLQLMMIDNCSIVVVDAKGDNPSYRGLEARARKEGMEVRYFSLEDEAGCLLRLLDDPAFARLTEEEQAQLLVQAFGIPTLESHGVGYFGAVIKATFQRLIQQFRLHHVPLTFSGLHRALLEKWAAKALKMSGKDFENGSHATFLAENLAGDRRLNLTGAEALAPSLLANAITADLPFQKRSLIYLKLPALSKLATARAIGRLYVRLLSITAQRWQGPRVEHVYVVQEEVAEFLEMSMATPVKQIRTYGLSYFFVHQNLSDLQQEELDFLQILLGNAAVKFFMSAGDDYSRDFLTSRGGERIRILKSTSTSTTDGPSGWTTSSGEQLSETIVPVIGPTELEMLNARDDLMVVMASPDKDLSKLAVPTFVETMFSVPKSTYEGYEKLGWPAADGIESILAKDIPVVETSLDALAPPKQTTPTAMRAHGPKRKRAPKPVDHDLERRGDDMAERLRLEGGK